MLIISYQLQYSSSLSGSGITSVQLFKPTVSKIHVKKLQTLINTYQLNKLNQRTSNTQFERYFVLIAQKLMYDILYYFMPDGIVFHVLDFFEKGMIFFTFKMWTTTGPFTHNIYSCLLSRFWPFLRKGLMNFSSSFTFLSSFLFSSLFESTHSCMDHFLAQRKRSTLLKYCQLNNYLLKLQCS